MRLLAFDPGTRVMGWAAMESDGRSVSLLSFGTHRPKDLAGIARKVESLVRRHRPREVVVERAFLAKNPRTFERLVEARAAIQIGAARTGRPVRHYAPAEVKREVARFGRASKEQIQRSVRDLFRLRRTPPTDAADAIALGLCHISRNR